MPTVDIQNLVRTNIRSLKPYHVDTVDTEIKLHANENPYPPPEELLRLFQEATSRFQLNRYPDPDCGELRKSISAKTGVPAENLVVGNGSDELIQLLMQVFCGPGDTIAYPDPTFGMYSIIAQTQGIVPVALPLNDQWDFTAMQFQEAIAKHKPRIIFLSYPNNPTGNCFSADAIQSILDTFSGIVVLDEAYYDFSRKSFIEKLKIHNNLVILRSLSKIGLAGLRVGYMAASPLIAEQMNKVRLPYNSNTVSQTLASLLLNNFELVQKQIDTLIEERKFLLQGLSKIDFVRAFPSDSNFILFQVEKEGRRFFEKLMENGILIRHLGAHPRLKDCLRVTIGTPQENSRFLEQTARMIVST